MPPNSFEANLMDSTIVFVTSAIALPVIALAAWIWVLVDRVDREFSAEIKGINFEA